MNLFKRSGFAGLFYIIDSIVLHLTFEFPLQLPFAGLIH